MASIHRQRKFEEYRNRMFNAKSRLKMSSFLMLLPSGGLWLYLFFYHIIKAFALLAGGGAFFGQIIMNYATGKNEESPLKYETYWGLMFYVFVVAMLVLVMRISKKRGFSTALAVIFIGTFIYGFVTVCFNTLPVWQSVLFMAAALYGFWCNDIALRQLKEFEELSKIEGYPDFVEILGEPAPIANTRGVYLRQYEKLKEESAERKKERTPDDLNDSCVDITEHLKKGGEDGIPADAMDELTTDFGQSIDELLKKAK
ncbi:MAG: hypothetical protein IJZ72_02685 [Oscillospiraceae bacterium]|nr:hypothetical protein [Oscillospiraceae bacterium]